MSRDSLNPLSEFCLLATGDNVLRRREIKRVMEHKNLVQRGNTLAMTFIVTNYNTPCAVKSSNEFEINGAAVFQTRVIASQINNGHTNTYVNLIFVRFFKLHEEDDLTYNIKFQCVAFSVDKSFTSDDGTWHLIHENRKQQYTFDVSISMDVLPTVNSFAPLHEDEELTDFELRGDGGAIRVHKAVLAAASPVFRRMMCGTWKETTEGHVDVPGTSKTTLQSLKDYVYLRTLPESGLEHLLILASYYMMPDLEQKCVDKLVQHLTAQNACDLLEFAAKNKVTKLVLAILDAVQNKDVKVKDIREHVRAAM